MKRLLTAYAGLLALAAAPALAQEEVAGAPLPAIDANADGEVDGAELEAFVAGSFETMDANGDGYVTEAESAGYLAAERYAAANANGDDGLSLQELQEQARKDFAAADKDDDGILR